MKQIAGYYCSWTTYSLCKIEEINPKLCSILYYAFAGLNEDGSVKPLDPWGDIQNGGYKKFNALKNVNPKLKTLLSIGGWNEGSEKYSNLVQNPKARSTFIQSAISYLKEYGFNGIDFDWEYPCARGGRPQDKKNFVTFLAEIRKEFRKPKHNYMLTVAVGVGISHIEESYSIPEISRNVDFINLMAYDIHSYLDNKTGENAPLFSNDNLNVSVTTNAWIENGADPQKLLLGVGSYGKTFTLVNESEHYIGAPTSGPGLPGHLTKAPGTLSYGEIVEKENSRWTKRFSTEQQVPYLYHGNQWIGYDDKNSIAKKMNFAKSKHLGGIMMWSIDMDDPRGLNGTKYPLLKTINEHL